MAGSGEAGPPAEIYKSGMIQSLIYDPFLALGERRGMAERRRRLLSSARGRVLEIGAGTGLNLDHYPENIDELLLSEPVPAMASRLAKRLEKSGRTGQVLESRAEALPAPDASVDTVVSTMVLCTVGDPVAALAEISRVLKPDGTFLFCEHVRSHSPRLERWQRRLARPWRGFADGCRCDQPTLDLVARALRIEGVEHESWRGMPSLVRPLVIGRAVRH
jgi:SAM-dependent methyltransferase